ncbi:MAG: hypothetical protein JWM10_3502 [Myxococcaceae bacterium]|nr:hypothetical protein [Myxococcaceae bacterium]
MRVGAMSRRGFLGGVASALLAGVGGRALAGCGSGDVSVRIRRIDGTVQGGIATVRASVAVTNHTNVMQTLPLRMALSVGGAEVAHRERTLNIAPAELLCYCIEVDVPSFSGSMSDATVSITLAEESASATLSALGGDPLRGCDYTCNF